MKKLMTVCYLAALPLCIFAVEPEITGVTAQLENPWNGKVYVSYKVTGDIAAAAKERGLVTSLKVTATDNDANETYTATNLSGDMSLAEGTHSVVWDMEADGLSLKSSNVVFTVSCEKTPALYCVVDLSAGASASSYPVTYLTTPPSGGFNKDEYKTTELVLRRIEPGTFIMGSDQSDESHRVTLTKPFYTAIFEMTQKQYQLVMGSNPSAYTGDKRPVENVSYDMIRGSSSGAGWPRSSLVDDSSFMGKFQTKTGLAFDLPTEAQWEYACRAGTTSTYNNGGNDESDLKQLGRYFGNASDGEGGYSSNHTTVGSYVANAWGLYDMHGNVWELCLDWFGTLAYGTDPCGAISGTSRIRRGGSFNRADVNSCNSFYRSDWLTPSYASSSHGFRLSRTVSQTDSIGNLCSGASAGVNFARVEPLSLSENLVAHYVFDGDANDSSGNGNDGMLHDVAPTVDRYGNANGACHFNGTSAYVEVPDSDSLREVGQVITLSAWVKPEACDGDWVSVVCKGFNNRQYGVQINTKTDVWQLDKNGNSKTDVPISSNIRNEWSHVAVIFTPTTVTAFLDGVLVGSSTRSGNIVENSEPLYIGIDPPGDDEYLTGDMDEVRIYNRALSTAEIRALSNGDNPTAAVIGDRTHVYQYDIGDGVGIVQTGIGTVDSSLTIPHAIDNKPVVAVGRYAFADCGDIEAVIIPSSVVDIGDCAFAGCSNLSQVTLSGNIGTLTVGGNAFDSTTEVTIEAKDGYELASWTNSVGRIVSDPFHSASAVTVSPVWQRTETATIDGHTWTYVVSDSGQATIGNGKEVAVDPAPVGSLIIPAEIAGCPVTGIGDHAFAGYEGLTSITIPSNVTSVGCRAFEGCTGLTNVVIESESLSCIMPGLMQIKFDTCFDITSTIDDADNAANVSGCIAAYQHCASRPWGFSEQFTGNVYYWNETNTTFAYQGQMYFEEGKTYAFGSNFDDDAYVKIGSTVVLNAVKTGAKTIATGTFACERSGWYCFDARVGDNSGGKGPWGGGSGEYQGVWSADFGVGYRDDGSTNTVQSGWSRLLDPGDGSLFRCDGMRTIFAGCSNIVSVTLPWSLVSRMSSMFPDAYDKLESIVLTGETDTIPEKTFAGCASLRAIEISSGVMKIGNAAFKDCTSLMSVTIPDHGTVIGDGAFSGCTGVRDVRYAPSRWKCGLVQAKFDVNKDFTSSIMDAATRADVSGVLMGYAYDTNTATNTFSDPVYGGGHKWNATNTTFGYAGYMYMEDGKEYVLGKYFDDTVRVVVDGVEMLNNTLHTDFVVRSFIPDFTGWHAIEVRLADGNGEKGPKGGTSTASASYWSVNMGIGWRDDGVTDALPESEWHRLMDPGDGSLFRVEAQMTLRDLLPDSYMLVTNVVLDAGFGGMIPENCLAGCASLTSVTIPAETIGFSAGAFSGCTSLTSIMLPNGIGTLILGANVCGASTTVKVEPIDGYSFGGWTNATGAVVADPFHSATAVTVAPWWRKIVDVMFNANGGAGDMEGQTVIEGDAITLAENGFSRTGYQFLGWSTSVDGDVAYADGATIPNVPASMDGTAFYAVWKPIVPDVVPANDIVFVHASETVTLSQGANDAIILYTTDGSNPKDNGRKYKGAFAVYKACTIRAVAYGAGQYSDEVSVTLTRADDLGEAANFYGYTMETDSAAPWTVDAAVSHDGVSSVRSGAIGHGGMTWMQTSVRKAGTVSFWWKAACEESEEEDGETYWYDYGTFLVDGVVQAQIAGNDTGWQFVSIAVPSGGKHTLRWEYTKDGVTSYLPDCIWLDQVQWVPADGSGHTLTTPEPVPYSWLDAYRLGARTDYETAGKAASGKIQDGRALQVWQEYVAGTDPTNLNSRFVAKIEMRDDRPIVTWEPDLNTNEIIRTYKIYGSETLEGGGVWQYPTNSLHRFFKVTVEMP